MRTFFGSTMPGSLRYARDYSCRRRAAAENPTAPPPRLYVAESTPSITGGMADHRFRMTTSRRGRLRICASLRGGTGSVGRKYAVMLKDLEAHRGASIVIAGEYQPPRVHAIAHAMNQRVGQRRQDGDLYRSGRSESGG